MLLAADRMTETSSVGGRAYFINDDEPVNTLEFFRPLVSSSPIRIEFAMSSRTSTATLYTNGVCSSLTAGS